MIKNTIAAVLSVMLISGASIAAVSASNINTDNFNITEKTVSASASSTSLSSVSTSTATTTTAEPTTEPTTLRTYYIKFLDFDGNLITTLAVEDGDPINYDAVDIRSLHKHIDVNTEQDFSSWDIKPDFADSDYTIHALSKTAVITLKSVPTKSRYFSTKGNVSLKGLDVAIKLSVQTPQKDKNGNYITEESTINVSESCTAKPSALSEAFAKSDKATISVYPIGDQKALCSFDIVCYRDLGDVNEDGTINSADASKVLNVYASIAASQTPDVSDKFIKLADVNMDGQLDSHDASLILKYYAQASIDPNFFDWEDVMDYNNLNIK
jgi:hypothetical protein